MLLPVARGVRARPYLTPLGSCGFLPARIVRMRLRGPDQGRRGDPGAPLDRSARRSALTMGAADGDSLKYPGQLGFRGTAADGSRGNGPGEQGSKAFHRVWRGESFHGRNRDPVPTQGLQGPAGIRGLRPDRSISGSPAHDCRAMHRVNAMVHTRVPASQTRTLVGIPRWFPMPGMHARLERGPLGTQTSFPRVPLSAIDLNCP